MRPLLPSVLVLAVLFLTLIVVSPVYAQEADIGINLEGYEYPYEVHRFELNSQGEQLEMAYMYEEAQSSNGQTVLLLHGKNFNGAYWEQTIEALLDRGYNVLVPDQIGFGKSSKPQHYHYTFHQLASNTKSLLDSLDIDRTTVLGHSMGGMLATRFALMYPEIIRQLILENPIGLEDWKTMVPYTGVDTWYEQELGKTFDGVKSYMRESYFDGEWKEEYNEWVYLLTGFVDSPDYPRYAWNAALTYDMVFTQPVLYEFEQLEVPTVLIIGQRDRTALGKNLVDEETAAKMGDYPALGKEVDSMIPESRLIELNDIGHLPHIEDFDQFEDVLLDALR